MISRVHSSILQGIDAIGCEVEADVAKGGMGEVKLVGLAEAAVKESVSRIQAALRNSGYRWAGPKVTINLAPADVRKDSAAFDLPIAVAVMLASGQFATEKIDDFLLLGELALVFPAEGKYKCSEANSEAQRPAFITFIYISWASYLCTVCFS